MHVTGQAPQDLSLRPYTSLIKRLREGWVVYFDPLKQWVRHCMTGKILFPYKIMSDQGRKLLFGFLLKSAGNKQCSRPFLPYKVNCKLIGRRCVRPAHRPRMKPLHEQTVAVWVGNRKHLAKLPIHLRDPRSFSWLYYKIPPVISWGLLPR